MKVQRVWVDNWLSGNLYLFKYIRSYHYLSKFNRYVYCIWTEHQILRRNIIINYCAQLIVGRYSRVISNTLYTGAYIFTHIIINIYIYINTYISVLSHIMYITVYVLYAGIYIGTWEIRRGRRHRSNSSISGGVSRHNDNMQMNVKICK